MSNIDRTGENKKNIEKSKLFSISSLGSTALIAAMILSGGASADSKNLTGTLSQKQAIELLKSQGKLLPNIPTDYGHYGRNYSSVQTYVYNVFPYGDHRQRYEADNLKNVDGKNIEIDNDVDSCNFLNETVYKANMDKIIPIIIDSQIDTIRGAVGEYEKVDWSNSKDFTGLGLTTSPATYIHMNLMADVLSAKKNNWTEADYANFTAEQRSSREDVGVRSGKTRLYSTYPADINGGATENGKAFSYIYSEAEKNPDKKYILSCSWTGGTPSTLDWFDKLANMQNVIIFVARSDPLSGDDNSTYAAHPATIEVGYVQSPDMKVIDTQTQALSFTGTQKDRVVPNPGTGQTGKMHGDGLCILGEWSTSQSTAFMTGMAANLWAQNPNWTKDEVISMLKRDTYKSSEYTYDSNGWNERVGYGIVQPGKTMKENIFPEIKTSLNKNEGKYYFTISNRPAEYSIIGDGISKDTKGYYIDLSIVSTGKHTVTFVGKCNYEAKIYDFPISRELNIIGLDNPIVTGISSHRQRADANKQKVYFENLRGQITNYKTGLKVNLKFPDGTKLSNITVDAQGNFNLSNTSSYPVSYNSTGSITMTVELEDAQGNKSTTDVSLNSDLIVGPEAPMVTGVLSTRQRTDATRKKVYFENLKGQITNYKTGLKVNLKFPDGTKMSNVTVDAQGNFNLSNTSSSPISFNEGDSSIKVIVEFEDDDANISTSEITLNANFLLPEKPVISGISGRRQRADANRQQVYFEFLKGQITNYKAGYKVNIKFNSLTTISNVTVDAQGNFNLTNTIAYPIAYKEGDEDIKMTVEIVDAVGNKNSVEIILTSAILTDVEEIKLDENSNKLKVYPNPVIDILNLDIPSSFGNVSVKIYNTTGQLYSTSNLSSDNNQIDLSPLKPGLYFVTVLDDKGNKRTEKIIKR